MSPPDKPLKPLDPLAPVMALGRRSLRIGAVIGVAGALVMHAAPASQAARSFPEMRSFASLVTDVVKAKFSSEIDVDTSRPPPPPPPPPPPEPEPPKEPPPKVAENEPPPPPPAPAEAAKVLTSEPDPDAPVDLTDQGFVTGTAERFAGGITAASGTSKTAVRDTNATPSGVPGGTGTAPAPPAPARDLSRAPTPKPQSTWQCPFPAEADLEGINHAVVQLIVTVNPDGTAKSATVLKDPGYGFGQAARRCAFKWPYIPGLDSAGKSVVKTTGAFSVTFRR
jgi:protein TonB